MKKIFAGVVAVTALALAGPAAAYQATIPTTLTPVIPASAPAGEPVPVQVTLKTDSNNLACTGKVEVSMYKIKDDGTTKKRAKSTDKSKVKRLDENGTGNFEVKTNKPGRYMVVTFYRKNPNGKDPCQFSRTAQEITIT